MRGVVLAVSLALAAVVTGYGEMAAAQDNETAARAAARKVGYEGVEALQAGQHHIASQKLERAYSVLRVPSLGLWSARALAKIGKLVEATERYFEVTTLPLSGGDLAIQRQAQADALVEAEATRAQLPSLRVDIEGADATAVTVTIDGVTVPKQMMGEATPVNPGQHLVEGTLADGKRVSTQVTLAVREQRTASLSFSAAAPSPGESALAPAEPSPPSDRPSQSRSVRPVVGWSLVALGGAGLVFGGVTGGLSLKKRGELDDSGCREQRCPKSLTSEVDSLNTMRLLSTVGLVAGSVIAATGVVLVATSPSKNTSASVWATPNGVVVKGAF